ncbi:ComF family protein [Microbulbifer sp. OS29]|uniref:ComF family protein n=1 Tax=Microbulbifer okhotskensis TaxID=2926617 RepID=A0A9X2EM07_9GAMM|nr:ComF family protein [Microbulbifer okhotskensis]MCO1334702.1 ComF family protein [Microbulbifer okhotskensis]
MVYKRLSNCLARSLARCLLCGARAGDGGVCSACSQELPQLGNACVLCALPIATPGSSCPSCLQRPPPFAKVSAAWQYAYPVNHLIQRFKYHRDLAAGHSLAQLAAQQLGAPQQIPDLLAPVPLHWLRYWQRGYNQAQLIASAMGQHWQLPVEPRLLRKTSRTKTQSQLRRAQRLNNLLDSFTVRREIRGLHIGLVDDVLTTGATLEAVTHKLLEAGAKQVSAFILARTP